MKHIALLIVCQAIWSSSYVAMKFALQEMPLGVVLSLRYAIAALVVLAIAGRKNWRITWKLLGVFALIGVLDFSLSPFFQLRALQLTYATDAAVLVAFEPMLSVLCAVIFLREYLHRSTIITFLVATGGLVVMSGLDSGDGMIDPAQRLLGNGFFFLSMCCEALYTIACRKYHDRANALRMVGVMMFAGACVNVSVFHDQLGLTALQQYSWSSWSAVLFLALGCSAFAYVCWAITLQHLTVNQAALSLFLQPIFGAIAAFVILGERPGLWSLLGAGIILCSLFIWIRGYIQRQGEPHGESEKVAA